MEILYGLAVLVQKQAIEGKIDLESSVMLEILNDTVYGVYFFTKEF